MTYIDIFKKYRKLFHISFPVLTRIKMDFLPMNVSYLSGQCYDDECNASVQTQVHHYVTLQAHQNQLIVLTSSSLFLLFENIGSNYVSRVI